MSYRFIRSGSLSLIENSTKLVSTLLVAFPIDLNSNPNIWKSVKSNDQERASVIKRSILVCPRGGPVCESVVQGRLPNGQLRVSCFGVDKTVDIEDCFAPEVAFCP